MKSPTIEIHGTGTHNRGAELMAIAIAERLRNRFPGVRLVVPPTPRFAPYNDRSRHGFLTTWPPGGRSRLLKALAPDWLSEFGGLVDVKEIDVVLDASGFAFSEQWGPLQAERLLARMAEEARKKQTLILMPQALGPFQSAEMTRVARDLFARAALVFARDAVSFDAAGGLCPPGRLRLAPDFTLNVRPLVPPEVHLPDDFTAVVPNIRMLDKTESADSYLTFLCEAIRGLRARNLNPVFLLHDARSDHRVVEAVAERGTQLEVITHPDPRALKAILGRATCVLGSRFHALVSSMAQGVPCIGVGWSHKYLELFCDFDSPDLLLADFKDWGQLEALLDLMADASAREERRRRISAAAASIKLQTEAMWQEVEQLIEKCVKK